MLFARIEAFCSAVIVKQPSSDNTPYEKIGDELHPLDTPFDIPESWEWIRFKDLVDYSMGKTPPRKETKYWINGTIPWVSIADLVADGTVTTTKECVNNFAAENTKKPRHSLSSSAPQRRHGKPRQKLSVLSCLRCRNWTPSPSLTKSSG